MIDQLADPRWRLANLYACRVEGEGKPHPFRPRPEQQLVIDHMIETPTVPLYIIKSRRLGLSTALCTFNADHAVWKSGWRGILIDRKQDEATKKMVEIIRFAVDNLDPDILAQIRFLKRNDSELRLLVGDEKEMHDSVIFATTGGRGGDCNMLHISEWGPIAATDGARSREIRTGAYPAARKGIRAVETTWMGGRGGDLWEMIQPILEQDPNAEGRIFFFPWHSDPVAVRFEGAMTGEAEQYFRDLGDKLGKTFTREQKLWWIARKMEQGIFMSREYPSTLDEAFSAPVEGAIYARFIDALRAESRIREFEWDRSYPVHTAWDLGSPVNTRTIYFQMTADEIRVIDHDTHLDLGPTERVAHIRGKGYPYGFHFLPHDADNTGYVGTTYREQLEAAGLANIRVTPRCDEIWTGINKLTELMPRMVIHAKHCARLIASLESYHTKEDARDGHMTSDVVHDWSSHDCDAMRQIAEAINAGMLKDGSQARGGKVISPIAGLGDVSPRRRRVISPFDS
ncbi:MAG: hypothetical protein MUC40_00690 [Akkermansiaceae bacterium]|jgi:hypothetical protein|nr:hypothetical protein [Akkermansiaceae bacterium]